MNEAEAQHQRLIDLLVERGDIRTRRVEDAFRAHPRHVFLPGQDLRHVYDPMHAIPIRWGEKGEVLSSSTAPNVMAFMLEALDVQEGQRVLEVGAGSGYNAALLADLVGAQGAVTTIELDEEVARAARERLAAGSPDHLEVVVSDGWLGLADGGAFDRIVVTAGASDLSPHWVEQLVDGGLLVVPLRLPFAQCIVAFRKDGASLRSTAVTGGGFIPLRGGYEENAPPPSSPPLSLSTGRWILTFPAERIPDLPLRALPELLSHDPSVEPAPASCAETGWWLALEAASTVWLVEQRPGSRAPPTRRGGIGLLVVEPLSAAVVIDKELLAFGLAAAERLRESLAGLAGKTLRIEAFPAGTQVSENGGARVVARRHHSFVARLE